MADLSKQRADFRQAFLNLLNTIETTDGGGDISGDRFDLIGMVKVRIDEMMPEGEGVQFEVQDLANTTDTLDLVINALLDPAAKELFQIFPNKSYIEGKASTGSAVDNTDGTGYVVLPDDYIRLKSFKMDGWEREVTEPINMEHPLYIRQRNIYTRGGKAKPVCVIKDKVITGAVTKVLEYYSLEENDTHTVDQFIYIPELAAENVQTNLQNSLAWLCAVHVLEIGGRSDAAKLAMEQYNITTQNLL